MECKRATFSPDSWGSIQKSLHFSARRCKVLKRNKPISFLGNATVTMNRGHHSFTPKIAVRSTTGHMVLPLLSSGHCSITCPTTSEQADQRVGGAKRYKDGGTTARVDACYKTCRSGGKREGGGGPRPRTVITDYYVLSGR